MKTDRRRFLFVTVALGASILFLAWLLGCFPTVDRAMIERWIAFAGPWGPFLIVALMTASIVASPIPSAPIALVSGAAFGHFYGAIYVAIGLFASSLTENQIIAFLLGVILSFFFYIGFESISTLSFLESISETILNIGINEHYKSMSRGVIDIRDMIYFLSIITLFVFGTRTAH